jgi:hypothetical protein
VIAVSVVSLIFGASLGPSLGIIVFGGGLGAWLVSRRAEADEAERQENSLAGMAGGLGAVFSGPLFASVMDTELSPRPKRDYVSCQGVRLDPRPGSCPLRSAGSDRRLPRQQRHVRRRDWRLRRGVCEAERPRLRCAQGGDRGRTGGRRRRLIRGGYPPASRARRITPARRRRLPSRAGPPASGCAP